MAPIASCVWVELALLPPGQSHYWSFDPSWDAYGSVFQATAYPEPPDSGDDPGMMPSRVEVTELFVLRLRQEGRDPKPHSRVNVTVTNCGEGWASYSLWVSSTPPRPAVRQRRHHDRNPPSSDSPADLNRTPRDS